MSTIESYGASGSAPKGSRENPYTYEEYERLNSEGKWTSAYVEGMGIVLPDVDVTSSMPGSGFLSDLWNWSYPQWTPWDFDEEQPRDSSNDNMSSGGGGGTGGGNGSSGAHGGNSGGGGMVSLPVSKYTPINKLGAAFAGISYHDEHEKTYARKISNGGWSLIPLGFFNGILFQNPLSGLKFSIWEKKENDRTVAYVCSYAGTDIDLMDPYGTFIDNATNLKNMEGIMTEQYAQAMGIAIALDLYCKSQGIALTFVGHSLGGGLAALSSMVTGRPAITFNPAAVMALQVLALEKAGFSFDDSNIYKYIMNGDYITKWQEALGFSAWGRRIDVNNANPQDDAHSIYTMYKNLK